MRGDVKQARGRAPGDGEAHGALSPTLVAWLGEEALHGRSVLDVGTGTGRLALHLAPRARRVVGIDTDAGALVEAQRQARRAGLANVLFVVADAEQADYRTFGQLDLVVAHLCMSDAIIARAGACLPPGGILAFAAFHTDQWRETGRASRFAYPRRAERRRLADGAPRGGAGGHALLVQGGGAGEGRRPPRPVGGRRTLGGLGAIPR
jgi:SAM-dependent methyltransferase